MEHKEPFNKELLVEGSDDLHVISALCKKHQIPHNFNIIDCSGVSGVTPQISVRFKASGMKTLGIIVDADDKPQQRWKSLSARLTESGFKIPEDLPESGLIVDNGRQRAGVWIMPNNKLNGMLEDFISFLIPSDDQLFPIVQSTLEDIETKGLNKYGKQHKSKATIHTWLAWQKDPGTPMGASITKSYLTTDEVTCAKFTNWLSRLFT